MSLTPTSPNPFETPQADCGPPPPPIEPSAARLDPPIQVRGHVSRSDVREARHLAGANRTSSAEFWSGMATLFLAVMALAGVMAIFQNPWGPAGYVWFAATLALLCYSVVVVAPAARERTLDALERESEDVEYSLTTDGFALRKEHCQVQVAWPAVTGFSIPSP